MLSEGNKKSGIEVVWEFILSGLPIQKMILHTLKVFLEEYNSKDDTMTEIGFQRAYIYQICPRDSKATADKGFVIIDN